MANSARRSKNLGSIFSVGKTMEVGIRPNLARSDDCSNEKMPGLALPSPASIFSELTGLPMNFISTQLTSPFTSNGEQIRSTSSKSLPESNIGFKLLKKSGWKEGSGLGVSEQGRLHPVEAQFKSDKRGIGAEKNMKHKNHGPAAEAFSEGARKLSTREKNLAKKARKLKAEADRIQEQVLKEEFYREFWPENV